MLRDERRDLPFPGLMHQSSTIPRFLGNVDGDTQLIRHDCSGHPVVGGATAPLLPPSLYLPSQHLLLFAYVFTCLLVYCLAPCPSLRLSQTWLVRSWCSRCSVDTCRASGCVRVSILGPTRSSIFGLLPPSVPPSVFRRADSSPP